MIEVVATILGGPIGQVITREAAHLLELGINKVKDAFEKNKVQTDDPAIISESLADDLKAKHGILDPERKRTL